MIKRFSPRTTIECDLKVDWPLFAADYNLAQRTWKYGYHLAASANIEKKLRSRKKSILFGKINVLTTNLLCTIILQVSKWSKIRVLHDTLSILMWRLRYFMYNFYNVHNATYKQISRNLSQKYSDSKQNHQVNSKYYY